MHRHFSFAILLTLLLAPIASAQDATITTWEGTLDARGTKLRLEIDVVEDGEKATGELRSLDQGNATFNVSDIQTDSGLSFAVPQLGAKFTGKLDTGDKSVKGTFTQGGVDLPLTLKPGETRPAVAMEDSVETLKEAWVGELDMGIMKPVMQFRVIQTDKDAPKCYFDSITEGATGFEGTWSIKDDELTFTVPKIGLGYTGTLNSTGDTAEGIWSQGGRKVPLTLKRQPTEYSSENVWENRPQRPVGPFPYDDESVTIANTTDDLTLAGTLTIPKTPGKHPAVILISGSGPQDRDETLMEHKPFLVLADYLSRRGIAVLRYDDRGTAKSTGSHGDATTEDFARDASAAVEFLKTHARINSDEIGLAGHSEGGLIAPIVCGLRDDVAFVVLMAATGVDGLTIIESQTDAMVRASKTKPEEQAEVEASLALNRYLVREIVNETLDMDAPELEKLINELIDLQPDEDRERAEKITREGVEGAKKRLAGKWMGFFINYDPRPALQAMTCPVLAIIGSKDLQVLPKLNMPEIEKALQKGGNKDVKLVTIDGLNHLFQKCETGSMNEYISIQETWNPEALQHIGDWIEKHSTLVK